MASLREQLETDLRALPGIEVGLWKETDLMCVFYKGRDFAHFHDDSILDIRLSQKIIKEENLTRPSDQKFHPNRSKNSRWIGLSFTSAQDNETIVHLVKRACRETL